MRNSPTISVVMSVYNGEVYLAEAIESILVQTYRDFEFIIIDDGSTDNSSNIIRSYDDPRIRFFQQKNAGLAASLNKGITLARGKYIARMDADDVSLPDRLKKQLKWLKMSSADVCGGWIKLFGGGTWRTRRYFESDDAIKLQLCFRTSFAHPTILMKTDLARKIPYDEKVRRGQDYDLWVRFALAGAQMTNIQEKVLNYRVHKQQVPHQQVMEHYCYIQQKYVNCMLDWPDAYIVMRKFSFASEAPLEEDARLLLDIIMSIPWASPQAKLSCFVTALRYVRPQKYDVYLLYKLMSHLLKVKLGVEVIPLWFQTIMGAGSDSVIYKLVKSFT